MPTTCETVTVAVTYEGETQSYTVPAFTRSFKEMKTQLEILKTEYLQRSLRECQPMSFGDFALFAIAKAAKDPLEV